MKTLTLSILAVLTLTSCAVSKTKLTAQGDKIKVVHKKPSKCSAVVSVIGENDEGVLDLATNHARNLAGEKSANTLHVTDEVSHGSKWRVHATGYICK
ncbi:MAG: hypothetical protein BM556_15450 [Bacteriovorax sp. MedPE-SWde]|nr:MAG: hypothetical protein BM556_15450 [Bacteriovorax sp. MedPE-SWde]